MRTNCTTCQLPIAIALSQTTKDLGKQQAERLLLGLACSRWLSDMGRKAVIRQSNSTTPAMSLS